MDFYNAFQAYMDYAYNKSKKIKEYSIDNCKELVDECLKESNHSEKHKIDFALLAVDFNAINSEYAYTILGERNSNKDDYNLVLKKFNIAYNKFKMYKDFIE